MQQSRIKTRPDRGNLDLLPARIIPKRKEKTEEEAAAEALYLAARGIKSLPAPAPSLAGELWPGQAPVMVAPVAHFQGEYPQCNHKAICKTRWVMGGEGDKVKSFARVNFSQWRGYIAKNGRVMVACPHCEHERVLSFCWSIERASQHYSEPGQMRYQDNDLSTAKKLAATLRKRNERGAEINQTTFPLENGRVICLHDAADIEGQSLPTDRKKLYHLVKGWALVTPKGKRAGHGLKAWGQPPKGKKEGGGQGDGRQAKRWRLIGENYGRVFTLLSAWLGEETKLSDKGNKLDLPAAAVVKFLDAAGIDYAIEGDVTFSRYEESPTSAKCDTAVLTDQEEGHREIKANPPNGFLHLMGVIE